MSSYAALFLLMSREVNMSNKMLVSVVIAAACSSAMATSVQEIQQGAWVYGLDSYEDGVVIDGGAVVGAFSANWYFTLNETAKFSANMNQSIYKCPDCLDFLSFDVYATSNPLTTVLTDFYKFDHSTTGLDNIAVEGVLGAGSYELIVTGFAIAPTSNPNLTSYDIAGTMIAAVPEPSSYAMLLAGLGLASFVARRRLN